MAKSVEITGEWLNDPYAKEWLRGSTKTTKAGYRRDFPKWLDFVGMTPTEQVKKRIQDLRIQNRRERYISLENHRKIECFDLINGYFQQSSGRVYCFVVMKHSNIKCCACAVPLETRPSVNTQLAITPKLTFNSYSYFISAFGLGFA